MVSRKRRGCSIGGFCKNNNIKIRTFRGWVGRLDTLINEVEENFVGNRLSLTKRRISDRNYFEDALLTYVKDKRRKEDVVNISLIIIYVKNFLMTLP